MEKTWNLYVSYDQLDTMQEQQMTGIFFILFSKELFDDLPYKFGIGTNTDQKFEDVVEKMEKYPRVNTPLYWRDSIFSQEGNMMVRVSNIGIVSFDDYLIWQTLIRCLVKIDTFIVNGIVIYTVLGFI